MNILLTDSRADSLFRNASEIYACRPLYKTRERHTVWARAAISVILKHEGYSFPSIGRFLGLNHATIMHHFRRHKDNLEFDREYKVLFDKFNYAVARKTLSRKELLNDVELKINEALLSLKAIGYDEFESKNHMFLSIEKAQLKTV